MSDRYDYLLIRADGSESCLHREGCQGPMPLSNMQNLIGATNLEHVPLSVEEDREEKLTVVAAEQHGEGATHRFNPRASELTGFAITGDVILTTRVIAEATQ